MPDTDQTTDDQLSTATRDELYEMARAQDVEGRSSMSKAELAEALRAGGDGDAMSDAVGSTRNIASRFEAFAELAQARARGEVVALPRHQGGNDRRLHVRQTIREDHATRIAQEAEDAHEKFDELADSLFSFFRGTALLFYRDMAGEDARMPTVLTLGDVHPENFGVMPSTDDVPIFGVNDFDEAFYAPFTWDLKRGAVGFILAVDDEGGYGHKRQRKVARDFVRGYIQAIADYAETGVEADRQMRMDNAPELIAELIEDALTDRQVWLAEDYHDEYGRGFRADDELVPLTSRVEEFQQLVDRWVAENEIDVPTRAGGMRVKDVAIRKGAGTASLGLNRYYVLIEGPQADASDDLLIEFKQARRSALAGLAPTSQAGVEDPAVTGHGQRIVHAQRVQLVRGDVFYGTVEFEGLSYMTRERAPYRDDIDIDDLSKSEWREYARICGRALAHAHALSDDSGRIHHDIEPVILEAIGARDLFVDDVVRFAEDAANRLRADHEHFRADHELGAFERVDRIFA